MRHDKRNEVYYWIKLRQDLMQSKEMKLLMRQPDGGWYFSIYVYLIMLSINSEGKLIQRVNDMEMIYDLTTITQELMFFKIDTIRVAIDILKKLGLLYEDETRVICITGFDKLVGSETGWAEVKRKQKERQMVGDGVEKVHAILHTNFPPEIRDKSIEYRDEKIDFKSIDHNDRNDKYDKYDKVTFSSDFVIINQLRNLKINQWHEEFSKAHVLTKYLVYSKYLEEGDMDNLIASNAFFENYLNSIYGFDELKKHVQYFLFQFRKLSKSDKGKIKNKLGYLTNAIKKNQRTVEWSNSSELKDILKLSESIQVKLNKEAKSLFPSDEIKQQLYCKENYLTYHNSEMKRLRQSFEKKCNVSK